MTTTRRAEGCWTCKLRRKKCDEGQPTCAVCDNLEISCTYGPKPTWMRGGEEQQRRAQMLKNDIKRNAAYRRERGNPSSNVVSDMMVSNTVFSTEPMEDATDKQTLTPESNVPASNGSAPFSLLPLQQHRCPNSLEEQSRVLETDFIMKYFDHVFPILFPFYRPGLFETGRSWLLLLLGKSKIAYHSTFSLASYFFTMALTEADLGREFGGCTQLQWEELSQHTDKCFESIRTDMLALSLKSQSETATKLEKVEMMESIIQVLIFETALGKTEPFNSHLTAAFTLLEAIMDDFGRMHQDKNQSKFCSVLLELGEPFWTRPGYSQHIWSPHQAGLRFSAGLLVFIDVVASTARQEAPRLLSYHPDILARIDDGAATVSYAEVRLSNITGCRNCVIRSIAEISALASWKKEKCNANSLSVVDLVDQASAIVSDLRNGILETRHGRIITSPPPMTRQPFDLSPDPSATFTTTLIWAYAAQLYLLVVVSGWQLSNAEVRENVAQIMGLLRDLPAYQLRAVTWPVCVAGCLASESEEPFFLALLSKAGKVYTAGALGDVRQIWERVWQTRAIVRDSTWDLASCFSILGTPVLLV